MEFLGGEECESKNSLKKRYENSIHLLQQQIKEMEVESMELRQETEHLRQHLKIEMRNREAYLEETALGHREEIQKLKDHHMTEI